MPAIHASFDPGVRELQDATKAFLTDQYDNGDYVATADDIAELQAATAAFLADQTDGESFYLDGTSHGLLLPGEHFLLPISTAVGRARSGQDTVREVTDLIDECLDAQMLFEDVQDTPLPEGSPKSSSDQHVVYTSFVDILGPDSPPKTPPFDARTPTLTISMTPTDLEGPDEVDRLLGICDDVAYDGPDALCPAHASYSAAFFDPTTQNLVPYTSLDTLLGMDYRNGDDTAYDGPDALCPARASYSAAFFDPTTQTLVPYTSLDTLLGMDYRKSGMFTFYDSDNETGSDEGDVDLTHGDLDPSITKVDYSFLHINTDLSTILEDDEPSSAEFMDLRSFLNILGQRRLDFLADEDDLSPTLTSTTADDTIFGDAELPFDKETVDMFSEMFTHDIWNNDPDLTLTTPIEQHHPTELIGEFEH
jgi:hypothetical protein